MMKSFIASASMTGALLLASASPAWAEGETLILEFYGERQWEVSCTLIQADGDVIEASDHARDGMATGRIAVRNVESGECTVQTGQNAMLRVTLITELTSFECPFLYTEDDACRTYFPGEVDMSFEIGDGSAVSAGS
jgi:hypothetical protein